MATVTVVSDLHLEARPLSLDDILDPGLVSDVLCLLGDIGDPSSQAYRDFLASCAARFPTVLLLAGNNEYRNHDGGGRTMAQTESVIRAAAAAHPNIHFLQNTTFVLGNVAFIGTTLWSYLPDTPLPPPSEDGGITGGGSHTAGAAAAAIATATATAGKAAATAVATSKPLVSVITMPQALGVPAAVRAGNYTGGDGSIQVQSGVASHRISDSVLALESASASPALTIAASPVVGKGTTPRCTLSAGSKQQQKYQHLPEPPCTQPPGLPALPFAPKLRPVILEGLRKLGLPVPIPFPRHQRPIDRPLPPAVTAAGGGDAAVVEGPRIGAAAVASGGITAPPRFVSHSQPPPDWLTSRGFGTSRACDFDACGGCGGGGGGGDAGCDGSDSSQRPCRRRHQLRHCVSLASLRPDEPCPSWRVIQAKCAADRRDSSSNSGGGSSSSSSESDALGSDSDNSQSSYGSDFERSESPPFNTANDGGRALLLRAAASEAQTQMTGVRGLCMAGTKAPTAGEGPPSSAAAAAAVVASSPIDVEYPASRISQKQQTAPGGAAGELSTSEPSTALGGGGGGGVGGCSAGLLPAIGVLSQPVSSFVIANAVPAFLSDRGSVFETGNDDKLRDPSAAPSDAVGIAVTTGAMAGGALPASGCTSAPSLPAAASCADTAAASSPKARSGHHHHHHHHHHHRHSSQSSSYPPPATIREFIGATSLDYRRIFTSPDGPAITPDLTNALFISSLEYVQSAVAAAREQGLVPIVLSHHAPSMRGTSRPTFEGHPSTHAYSTDLEPYLEASGISAWYCGHTHFNFDMQLAGGVRLASNQFGSQPKPADGYSRTWQHPLPSTATDNWAVGSMGRTVTQCFTSATSGASPASFPVGDLNSKGHVVMDCLNFQASVARKTPAPLPAADILMTGPIGFGATSSVRSAMAY